MRRVGEKFAIRSSLIVGIVGWRLVREIVKLKEWDEWRNVAWAGNGLLLLGWVIGYFLPDIDDLFYVYISDPGDKIGNQAKTLLTGGDVRRAWDLLVATRGERKNLPVHNILTGLAVAVAGGWRCGGCSWEFRLLAWYVSHAGADIVLVVCGKRGLAGRWNNSGGKEAEIYASSGIAFDVVCGRSNFVYGGFFFFWGGGGGGCGGA